MRNWKTLLILIIVSIGVLGFAYSFESDRGEDEDDGDGPPGDFDFPEDCTEYLSAYLDTSTHTAYIGQEIEFDATRSWPGECIDEFNFDFDDGNTDSSSATTQHSYSGIGEYTVELEVVNNNPGVTDTDTVTIDVIRQDFCGPGDRVVDVDFEDFTKEFVTDFQASYSFEGHVQDSGPAFYVDSPSCSYVSICSRQRSGIGCVSPVS